MIDSLGDRMKGYEREARTVLPPRSWTVIRLDGRAFHTWTKGLARPFDEQLIRQIGACMKVLCEEIAGTVIGYCQSDEISLIVSDFQRPTTQAFYGGQVQKIASVSASILTANFARGFPNRPPAVFDSRVFTLPDRDEVRNYLLWRQRDAQRNAISMLASESFSAKQLHGVPVDERRAMLERAGVNFAAVNPSFLNGQTCHRTRRVEDVHWTDSRGDVQIAENVERWAWVWQTARPLDCQPLSFLDSNLPADPQAVTA